MTNGNLTSHGDIFEGKVLMLVCRSSKNLNIIAIAASNYCYVFQAKHNIATATIGEQPTNPFSCLNTTYSTLATSKAVDNNWPTYHSIPTI
jgi:hypothetical protein